MGFGEERNWRLGREWKGRWIWIDVERREFREVNEDVETRDFVGWVYGLLFDWIDYFLEKLFGKLMKFLCLLN